MNIFFDIQMEKKIISTNIISAVEISHFRNIACKYIPFNQFRDIKSARDEIEILYTLKGHAHIIGIYGYSIEQDGAKIYMPYIHHTLRDMLGKVHIPSILYQLLSAVGFCHMHGIGHFDIKTANILFKNGSIFLIDFDMAEKFKNVSNLTHANTLFYRPPELFKGNHIGRHTDIWAVGCVFGELLKGDYLFRENFPTCIYDFIEGNTDIDCGQVEKSLLRMLLRLDPNERPNTVEAKNHRYFKKIEKKLFD